MRSCQGRLLWVLLAALALLLLIAVASGAIYLVLRQQRSGLAAWHDPAAALAADEIVPELALYPLAGASEVETIDAALTNGDLETAYAGLLFGLGLSDVQRIGRMILLGNAFAEAGQSDRADQVYQQVFDMAVLSAELNDPARADALLASGKGWATLGREAWAREAYDQVYLIAVSSPYLQMAHRRHLLTVLEEAYRDLGDTVQQQAIRQLIVQFDKEVDLQPPRQPGESPNLPLGTDPISSPAVGALEEARRQAVYALLQSLAEGGDPPPDLVSSLGQALQAEDVAKLGFYQQELDAASQLSRRVNLRWQMIRWLTLKYRIATGGFGLSLVPGWEEQAAEIQSSLSKAYEDLYFDYEDLVSGLPQASLVEPGSYEVRRRTALAGRLGLYPNYPAQQLAEKLQDAVANLMAAGLVEQLYVDVASENGDLHFFLSPPEEYGRTDGSP